MQFCKHCVYRRVEVSTIESVFNHVVVQLASDTGLGGGCPQGKLGRKGQRPYLAMMVGYSDISISSQFRSVVFGFIYSVFFYHYYKADKGVGITQEAQAKNHPSKVGLQWASDLR